MKGAADRTRPDIRLMARDRSGMTVEQRWTMSGEVTLNWYSPVLQMLSGWRIISVAETDPGAIARWNLLGWNLYTIIGHTPMPTAYDLKRIKAGKTSMEWIRNRQRVMMNGEPWVDEFGLYVYLTSRIGPKPDQDLRYDDSSTEQPELITL